MRRAIHIAQTDSAHQRQRKNIGNLLAALGGRKPLSPTTKSFAGRPKKGGGEAEKKVFDKGLTHRTRGDWRDSVPLGGR